MKRPEQKRPTVLIFLINIFAARNFLYTPLWDRMTATRDLEFVLVSGYPPHGEYALTQKPPNIRWEPMGLAFHRITTYSHNQHGLFYKTPHQISSIPLEVLMNRFHFEIQARLSFRFNHMKGFKTHRLRQQLPGEKLLRRYGQLPSFGWPFPGSTTLFDALCRFHHTVSWPPPTWFKSLLRSYDPTLVLIAYPQNHLGFVINHAAQRRGIPVVAYINSWDQLTTKGPLPPGLKRVMVWNERMRQELLDFHGFPSDRIDVVGPIHLDMYHQRGMILPREDFLRSIGVDPSHRLIVYGPNPTPTESGEVAIAHHLARQVAARAYAEPATLVIRPHPLDTVSKAQLSALGGLSHVQVRHSSDFGMYEKSPPVKRTPTDLKELVNLMKHADVVLTGPSTLALDAIAFDTPVVHIGFNGDHQLPPEHSILTCYEYDHYAPVIAAKGTRLVKSYAEMDAAIRAYLHDPTLDTAGRDRIRREQLEPFDGRAGERVVNVVTKLVQE
jgi:hypothetical protein